jgi:hypothetical protein
MIASCFGREIQGELVLLFLGGFGTGSFHVCMQSKDKISPFFSPMPSRFDFSLDWAENERRTLVSAGGSINSNFR